MKVENGLWEGTACRRFVEALRNRDLERAVRCFAPEGCLITPDRTAVHGRERIRPLLAQMIERRTAVEVEQSTVLSAGDSALACELWSISSECVAGERFTLVSRPMLVLRRRGTEWQLEIAALWGWG